MLPVQKYLQDARHNLETLNRDYGIDYKVYPDENCVILTYSMFESPKEDPIVMDCRGLILRLDNPAFDILCKPFTRFFNWGECPELQKGFDFSRAIVMEKVDGSLVSFWWNPAQNNWCCSTRSMAFAEGKTTADISESFKDAIMKAVGGTQEEINQFFEFQKGYTFTFEFTSPENRVIKNYGPEYKLTFLACHNNETGEYMENSFDHFMWLLDNAAERHPDNNAFRGVRFPKFYPLADLQAVKEYIKKLGPTDEGFVCYDYWSKIRVKVKNPSYLELASIRVNGGLTERSIINMITTGNIDEYLSYFPEDAYLAVPYIKSWERAITEIRKTFNSLQDMPIETPEERKAFALAIKDYPFSKVLFNLKDGRSLDEIIKNMNYEPRKRLIYQYLEKNC